MAEANARFKASLVSESVRSAATHIDKSVKRDNSQVSLIVSGKSGKHRVWMEGHGHFRHMQVAVESSGVSVKNTRGLTMDQKTLQTLARGSGELELIADDKTVKFRKKGSLGDLTGKIALIDFDGKVTNPRGKVTNETKVDLTGDQAKAIGNALKLVDITNAVAKGKSMELWIRLTEKGTRLLVFDQWHAAMARVSSVKTARPTGTHIDKDLFVAVAAMPGDGWSMRVGSDVIRVYNRDFAIRSSAVESQSGPTANDMLKVISKVTKQSKSSSVARMQMGAADVKEIVRDLGVTGYQTDAISITKRKAKLVWACQTSGGRASLAQTASTIKAKGDWPEVIKISPNLLNDIVRVLPDDGDLKIFFVEDVCLMVSDKAHATYFLMLS